MDPREEGKEWGEGKGQDEICERGFGRNVHKVDEMMEMGWKGT